MALWNFIAEKLLPLFGTVPEQTLADLEKCFWTVLVLCVIHFLVYVPYRGLLALIHYKRWGGGKL